MIADIEYSPGIVGVFGGFGVVGVNEERD